ncbi:ABC transporter ATP-binding protein [Altererythrobacter sp. ZODW24]|uniref:ABC transporter ATP-binding protein n=1 Tax=Altererythrobacter sp. ZODW24 TaxID=2185142 RepID=UPI000DF72DFA|nr:ABC transporter ATP-binding protein [Altererythrobacter sp. ZODW24]
METLPTSPKSGVVRDVLRLAGGNRIGWLAFLSVVAALTEGFGFAMLVPLLASMGGGTPEFLGPKLAELIGGVSLWVWLGIFAALITVRAVADYWRALAAHDLSVAIVDGLRSRLTAALLAAEWRALSGMRQSDNRALLISTIDRTGDALDASFNIIRATATLSAIGLAAFVISPLVALAAGGLGIVVLLAYANLRGKARVLGEEVRSGYDTIYARLEEALGALRVIKGFGKEADTQSGIAESFGGLRTTQREYLRLTGRARVAFTVLAAAALGLLVWLSAAHWSVPLIVMVPLVALFARGASQFTFLQDNWQIWAHHSPALTAARDMIAETEANAELVGAASADSPVLNEAIELAGVTVCFREGQEVLDQLDMSLPANSSTALTGPSGGGKSTLADLLAGLISPDDGQVLIDGTPLDGTLRNSWRRSVAYVQQEPVLFGGSVADNLRWADANVSEDAIRDALSRASASFAFDLPGGIDCQLGEGGKQLSGGERQRIALARALIMRPQLLILDEATSALDDASDEAIAKALSGLKGSLTILIISHRGALAKIADRTVRLDNGKIVSVAI